MAQPLNLQPESSPDPLTRDHQEALLSEKSAFAIRLLLFRGGDVETCDKLAWLYMNYGVMQHAVALLEYAYETGMDELAKNGIFYGLNLPTNS